MIQHVSFDMWGTIIKGNPAYKKYLAKSIKEYLEDTLKMKNLSETYHVIKETESYINHCNSLSGKTMSEDQMFFLLLTRYGVKHREITRAQISFLKLLYDVAFRDYPPLFIDLPRLIQVLFTFKYRNITTSICSNTSFIRPDQLDTLLNEKEINSQFSFNIYSGTCNLSKPNPEIFRRILYHLRASKRESVIHVGDCIINDGACINEGIRFLQVYGDSENNIGDVLSNLI